MKKEKVIVIAGTTESRKVIEQLLKEGKQVIATTATSLGTKMLSAYPIEVREGKLEKEGFLSFFEKEAPVEVIDASHPFAVVVTKNVKEACEQLKIPYKRVERETMQYEYEQITFVDTIEEAIAHLNGMKEDDNLLLTTGSNTLSIYLKEVNNGRERIYARVLDHEYSYRACENLPIDKSHILYQNPPFSKEDTLALLKKYHCKILVTKESGKAGGVDQKIEACKEANIPVLMIRRPKEESQEEKKDKKGREEENPCTKKANKKDTFGGLLIAGTGSGCGKTTVVCALMKAFHERKMKIAPFKCGPDYIDPMLHCHITKKSSHNLDGFFMEEESLQEVFYRYAKTSELAIVEGVMGFYDGMGLSSIASSYEISEKLHLPVVLVVSARGMSATLSAVIKGMKEYKKNRICGVILNQCSKAMYERLKIFLQEELGILVVGYLPVEEEVRIKERHLGLMTAEEIEDLDEIIERLGALAEQCFDLDMILQLANTYVPPAFKRDLKKKGNKKEERKKNKEKLKIAVSKDEAFCFCYEDNIEYLKEQGAEILFFSPLTEKEIPKEANAIYLVGGYPELYAKQLVQNESMIKSVQKAVKEKIPMIAECGGYLYLCETLRLEGGETYPFVGAIPQEIVMTKKLNMHFGYVELVALKDGLLAKKGERLKAHEFHYSKEEKELSAFQVEKPDKSRSWNGGYHTDTIYAGYPHFHFRSNKKAMERFFHAIENDMFEQKVK